MYVKCFLSIKCCTVLSLTINFLRSKVSIFSLHFLITLFILFVFLYSPKPCLSFISYSISSACFSSSFSLTYYCVWLFSPKQIKTKTKSSLHPSLISLFPPSSLHPLSQLSHCLLVRRIHYHHSNPTKLLSLRSLLIKVLHRKDTFQTW